MDSPLGATALVLAARLDGGDVSAAGLASLAKQFTAVLALVVEDQTEPVGKLAELRAQAAGRFGVTCDRRAGRVGSRDAGRVCPTPPIRTLHLLAASRSFDAQVLPICRADGGSRATFAMSRVVPTPWPPVKMAPNQLGPAQS